MFDGKTANGLVRHGKNYDILSVIDATKASQDSGLVLDGVLNGIPLVAGLAGALAREVDPPSFFIVGVAPTSGLLSPSACPRLEFDLAKVEANAGTLVDRCAKRGISVTGITKVLRGLPALASTLTLAGVAALGDSRIDNLERIGEARRREGTEDNAETVLVRSPMSCRRWSGPRSAWGI